MTRSVWSPIPRSENQFAGRFWADPGWRTWRPLGTADWEILVTERGRGRFVHGGGHLEAGPSRVILLCPGFPHDHGPAPGIRLWEVAWVHFQARDTWMDLLEWPETAPGLMSIDLVDDRDQRRLLALIDELRSVQHLPHPNRRRLCACLLEQLLLQLDARNPHAGAGRDPRITAIIDRLVRGKVGRGDLASLVGLSPSRLSYLFHREMGMSLPAFRERLCMERAAQLLDGTAKTIAAIAAECGYDDPFYFSNRFRRSKGMSPSGWRSRPGRPQGADVEPPGSGWSGDRRKR